MSFLYVLFKYLLQGSICILTYSTADHMQCTKLDDRSFQGLYILKQVSSFYK